MKPSLMSCLRTRASDCLVIFRDFEQIRDAQTRIAMDEVQYTVMGAPEPDLIEDAIGLVQ